MRRSMLSGHMMVISRCREQLASFSNVLPVSMYARCPQRARERGHKRAEASLRGRPPC